MERIITYKNAISEALKIAMRTDENIVLMGEDLVGGTGKGDDFIDAWGGPFNVTKGFVHEFGLKRVLDTPISESAFTSLSATAAIVGLRPIVEIMYSDFMGVAFDQFLNQIPKLRYMFGGQVEVPITVRTTYGCGWRQAAHHSQANYSLIVHIPGWYVIAPSNPYDMKGGLLAAIRNDNPVCVYEHRLLYDKKGTVPEGDYELPFGKGEIKKVGNDITIVSIGLMVSKSMNVANKLESENINLEIIDPIWLSPLDEEIILNSVKKTGKLLIIDEDNPRCSVASDIAAIIAAKGFQYLKHPIRTLNCPHTPVPYSSFLEDAYVISEDDIEKSVKSFF